MILIDTDSFIIGMRVFVDGVKPGRIQFIGETKFGPGEWAGVFLDEPIGKNDGSVMNTRQGEERIFSERYQMTLTHWCGWHQCAPHTQATFKSPAQLGLRDHC